MISLATVLPPTFYLKKAWICNKCSSIVRESRASDPRFYDTLRYDLQFNAQQIIQTEDQRATNFKGPKKFLMENQSKLCTQLCFLVISLGKGLEREEEVHT